MKIKTSLVQEMHGSIGRPYLGDMTCFRTDKYGNIVGLRKPYPSKLFTGKQPTYQHQLQFLARYWRILTAAQKAAYDELGDLEGITGYNYFIREKYPVGVLNFLPIDDMFVTTIPEWMIDYIPQFLDLHYMMDKRGRIFLNCSLPSISRKISISSAELRLYYYYDHMAGGEDLMMYLYKVLEPWDEATITWDNQPAISETPTTSFEAGEDGRWWIMDVTDDIQDFIDTGEMFYGWAIDMDPFPPDRDSLKTFRSKETFYNNRWPYLKLELT